MGKKNKSKTAKKKNHVEWREWLTLVPGLLMCVVVLIMLAADLAAANPEQQYELYPALFRTVNILVVLAGAVYILLNLADAHRREQLKSRLRSDWTWKFFAGLLLCIAVSTCINGLTHEAIYGIPYRNIGIFTTAAFILIYMGVSSFISTDGMRMILIILFCVTANLIAVGALYDRYIGEIPAFQSKKELSAIFFNGNHYGYFLVMAVLAGFGLVLYTEGHQMIIGALTSVLNLILLALNHSLGCILAVLITAAGATLYMMIREPQRRKRVSIITAVAVLIAAAVICTSSDVRKEFVVFSGDLASIMNSEVTGSLGHNRWKLWEQTMTYISEKPLMGYGCEGISFSLYKMFKISNPHNELLTYAAYYGIPAMFMYTAGIVSVFVYHIRNGERISAGSRIACMAAAGYFISSIAGVAMFYTAPFFFIFTGLALCKNK